MSYVRINITDQTRTTSGDVHGSRCDALVAALAAEPETIEEFELALARFIKREDHASLFAGFGGDENLEPYDAGIVVIDLAARIVASESTYSSPSQKSRIRVKSSDAEDQLLVPVELSDDWLFLRSIPEYEGTRRKRSQLRVTSEPLDAREILYGRALLEFIARECSDAEEENENESLARIHTKWLMTPREDLRGETPRKVLLEKHDFINSDLHARLLQHSFTGECPPALPLESKAYRLSGFGTHELVVYYDLVRYLLGLSLDRPKAYVSLDGEVELLEKFKSRWMTTPDPEYDGRTPEQIIESERRRVNIRMSARESIIDEDCPICVAIAADPDMPPSFWFLDGSSMDEGFEFSFFRTREEYDAEQRSRQEFMEDFERRREEVREQTREDWGI